MCYDDFGRLDFEEFAAVYNAYVTQRDFDYKESWERIRVCSVLLLQPHMKRGSTISPQQLLPLPWDKKEKRKDTRTAAEQRARTAELMRRAGYLTKEEE